MAPGRLRIVADARERKSGIPGLLSRAGLDTEVRTLPVGDYIVAPETAVERKSLPDLVSSVVDGRLYDQCSRLGEHFERPVLVVEGSMDEVAAVAENPMVVYGALARVAMDYRIPVLPTASASHTARLLASMCARRGAGPAGPLVKRTRRSSDPRAQQLSLLAALPGVGEKLAERMLERFGSPAGAFAAPAAQLAAVPGVGQARARRMRAALGGGAGRRAGQSGL